MRLLPFLLILVLALSACGGDKKAAASGEPQGNVEQQLGFDQSSIDLRLSRAEARIRDCMKGQGFDYVPVDPASQRAALLGGSHGKDEEKQFGYYVTTLWGRGRAQADPNERVRSSLSPADRAAYDRAIGGEYPGATFQDAFDTGDFTKLGGCRRKAIEAVFGGAQVLGDIQGKLDALDERIVQDQRMQKAVEKWRSCMHAAGYDYIEPDDIDVELEKRLEKLVGPLPGKFQTGPPPGRPAASYDRAAVASLQREELATWRADTACERKHITPVEDVVQEQYEAKFRRENQGLFRQVKPAR